MSQFQNVITYYDALCLYGNDGEDYTESEVRMTFDYCNKDCNRCNGCVVNATIHHSIENIRD